MENGGNVQFSVDEPLNLRVGGERCEALRLRKQAGANSQSTFQILSFLALKLDPDFLKKRIEGIRP